jgi:hypothetical protein
MTDTSIYQTWMDSPSTSFGSWADAGLDVTTARTAVIHRTGVGKLEKPPGKGGGGGFASSNTF